MPEVKLLEDFMDGNFDFSKENFQQDIVSP